MKIVNHTNLPDEYLKANVKTLTRGITRRFQEIVFSYTKRTAYHANIKHWFSMAIHVAIAKQESGFYPINMNERRNLHFNFPKYEVNNEEELALCLLAHEIYHAKANIHHWKSTEKRAEAYAFKILTRVRGE